MNILNEAEMIASLKKLGAGKSYKAMYSTQFGGIIKDPAFMVVPLDDHMVHRGDGVFEAIRFTPEKIYLLRHHVDRLFRSAEFIGLKIPHTDDEIVSICYDLQEASGLKEGILRIFVGRGGGDYSANPYATTGSQLHIVVTDFKPVPAEKYSVGASMMISKIPVKPGVFSQIKSLNYLPNVLMKKESVDAGYDLAVGLTTDQRLAEGPTENILLVMREGRLVAPRFDYTLRGTTLLRVLELAKAAMESRSDAFSGLTGFDTEHIYLPDLISAREVMIVGTTWGVTPVTRIEKQMIGDGKPGPVAIALNKLFEKDLVSAILTNQKP